MQVRTDKLHMYIQGTPAQIHSLAECALRRVYYRQAIFLHIYRLIALSAPEGKMQRALKSVVILISFYFVFFKIVDLKLRNFKLRPRGRDVGGV